MPRVNKNQVYGRVERKLWRNKTFRDVLSDDARLMWLYLMTTFREARLPGLVEATILNIMEDLGWHERGIDPGSEEHEGIMIGAKRCQEALGELTAVGWVEYSKSDRLLTLKRAVLHNLPANEDVVNKWTKTLSEFPNTDTKRKWIENAVASLRLAYGKVDARFKRLNKYWLGLCQPIPFDGEPAETIDESSSVCTPCEPNVQAKTPELSLGDEHRVLATNTNTSTSTSTKHDHKHKHNTEGGGGDDVPPSASETQQKAKPAPRKKPVIEKPENPPNDFTSRQTAFYRALQETEFYVRGQKSDQTAFQVVKDPVRLARMLGKSDTFPLVDVGIIGRLGIWTHQNKKNAKTDIGRFIIGRARSDQENPTRAQRGQNGQSSRPVDTTSAKRRYGDLQAKTNTGGRQ